MRRGRVWFALQFAFFLALLAAPFLQRREAPRLLRVLGLGVLASGCGVGAAGYRALGGSHSPWTTPIAGGRLVTTGIYGWMRHPIYAGWCLGALGGTLLTGSWLGTGVSAALMVFYDLKAREEERLLAERYPEYRAYTRQTSRFVPGAY